MQEFEGTFLNIDVDAIQKKLSEAGATHRGEFLYRSITFDYPDLRLDEDASWVRLRDEGDTITLAFKKRLGASSEKGDDDGMLEHEIEVSDFEATAHILRSIGLTDKFFQEQKRSRWQLGDVMFDIDTRPMLEPYLEIESTSNEKVDEAAKMLGLDVSEKKICSATQIYALSGIRDKDYKIISFDTCIKK